MSTDKQRVPFGSETRCEIIAVSCPGCNARRGHYHEYGCPLETCPECGGRLLQCGCKALGIIDSMNLARAVADSIADKAEIHRALEHGSKHLDRTYFEEGVMSWIISDLTKRDPAAREMMNGFMADMGFRPVGDHYAVTADNVAPLGRVRSRST